MRSKRQELRIKLCIFFFSALFFILTASFSSQPALAYASHIVRLKYEDGSPVADQTVMLRTNEFDTNQICGGDYYEACHLDCSRYVDGWGTGCGHCPRYYTGLTWITRTDDSHGIAVLSARDISSNGNDDSRYSDIQKCSSRFNNPLAMAVPYLNSSGYWRLDRISGYSQAYQKYDSSSQAVLREKLAGDRVEYASDPNDDHEDWTNYWLAGYSYQSFGNRANIARIDTGESGGACGGHRCTGKPFNIYWEWTWVGSRSSAQNLQNQPFLALAGNLWNSILGLFPKKLI